MEETSSHKKKGLAGFFRNRKNVILALAVLIVLFFWIKPLLTGYATASLEKEYQDQISALEEELLSVQTSLKENKESNRQLLKENKALSQELSLCTEQTLNLNQSLSSLQDSSAQALAEQKEFFSSQVSELKSELNELQERYDQFVKKTADSVCCKAKVDNPKINYYLFKDNSLYCLEEGQNHLNCPFG